MILILALFQMVCTRGISFQLNNQFLQSYKMQIVERMINELVDDVKGLQENVLTIHSLQMRKPNILPSSITFTVFNQGVKGEFRGVELFFDIDFSIQLGMVSFSKQGTISLYLKECIYLIQFSSQSAFPEVKASIHSIDLVEIKSDDISQFKAILKLGQSFFQRLLQKHLTRKLQAINYSQLLQQSLHSFYNHFRTQGLSNYKFKEVQLSSSNINFVIENRNLKQSLSLPVQSDSKSLLLMTFEAYADCLKQGKLDMLFVENSFLMPIKTAIMKELPSIHRIICSEHDLKSQSQSDMQIDLITAVHCNCIAAGGEYPLHLYYTVKYDLSYNYSNLKLSIMHKATKFSIKEVNFQGNPLIPSHGSWESVNNAVVDMLPFNFEWSVMLPMDITISQIVIKDLIKVRFMGKG